MSCKLITVGLSFVLIVLVSAERVSAQYVAGRWRGDYYRSCDTILPMRYAYVYVGNVRPKGQNELERKRVWFGKVPGTSGRTNDLIFAGYHRLGLPPAGDPPPAPWVVHRHVRIEFADESSPTIPPPEISGWRGDHTVFVPHPDGGWRAKRFGSTTWDRVQGIEIVQEDVGPPEGLPLPDVIVRGERLRTAS